MDGKVESRTKPTFKRQCWYRKKRLGTKWRAAKGIQSKVRLNERSRQRRPRIGWGTPNKNEVVRIETLKQIENLKGVKEIIIGSIGKKKREEIIKKANEMKIKILNKYKMVEKK